MQIKRPHISHPSMAETRHGGVSLQQKAPKNDSLALSFIFELSNFHFY